MLEDRNINIYMAQGQEHVMRGGNSGVYNNSNCGGDLKLKGYGAAILNATSAATKERLCKEHMWLVQTYEAVEFQKVDRGTVYRGVVDRRFSSVVKCFPVSYMYTQKKNGVLL